MKESDIFDVSIIVPIYNVSCYIEDCLSSIERQKYQGRIECLLVDDCGTDDSMLLVSRFLQNYRGPIRFRILRHTHNQGLSAARNTGIHAAQGTYIYCLDSDDWIYEDCLDVLMQTVNEHSLAEIVFAGADSNNDSFASWMRIDNKDLPVASDDTRWIKTTMLSRMTLGMTAWNKLVKRSFIEENNLYFWDSGIHEDEAWNFMMAKHAKHIAICKHNTYFYNYRENSIMTNNEDSTDRNYISYKQYFHFAITHIDAVERWSQVKVLWSFLDGFRWFVNDDNFGDIRKKMMSLSFKGVGLPYFIMLLDALLPTYLLKQGMFWRIRRHYLR